MDSIAKTSLLTAAMRAVENERDEKIGKLFSDPFAARLAGAEGQQLLARAIEAAGDQPAIAIRTRFIDDCISSATNEGARQLVMLASGMDTRAWRMKFPSGFHFFELDRREVLNYKEKILASENTSCSRKSLAVDLREDWVCGILEAGFNSELPTIWIVEGLVMYLDASEVHSLLKQISSLVRTGDHLVMDVLSETLLQVPHMKNQLQFLSSIGAPWKFGCNDPKKLLAEFGWDAKLNQPGNVAPDRWPFPTAPLEVPNVPRGYYVHALKL